MQRGLSEAVYYTTRTNPKATENNRKVVENVVLLRFLLTNADSSASFVADISTNKFYTIMKRENRM